MTSRVQAANLGIRRGSLVMFYFKGQPLLGRVARVSKRVTVLVEDAKGARYTDGRRYAKYSAAIGALTAEGAQRERTAYRNTPVA